LLEIFALSEAFRIHIDIVDRICYDIDSDWNWVMVCWQAASETNYDWEYILY